MSWTTPKTDWVATDYFNYTDYNRIKGNLLWLNDKVEEHFLNPETWNLGNNKNYQSYFYASEFNAFENCLESINNRAYGYDIGMKQQFSDLGVFIDYKELNRIEGACLRLYNMIMQIEGQSRRVAFRANGTDFVDNGVEVE